MSLDTYANLKTAVQDWIIRNGDSDFTSAADDILDLAEARIHYGAFGPFASDPLRIRAMEAQTILKTGAAQDGGTSGGSANAQTVTLGTAPTLAVGLTISFTAGFSNSGAMTLNANGTMRFSDIHKTIEDVSQRMLTVTLRTLESDGLVERKVYAEVPPRVEYCLTDTGGTLIPHIEGLVGWALENMNIILDHRKMSR